MSDNPSADQLQALSAALPPSERLQGAQVADVLSGLVAFLHHGEDILHAAEEGSAGVLDFLHGKAVDHAQDNGHDEPVRGQVAQVTPATAPAPSASGVDYDKLAAAIVRAQAAEKTSSENAAPPVAADAAVTPAPTVAEQSAQESQSEVPQSNPPAPAPAADNTSEGEGILP